MTKKRDVIPLSEKQRILLHEQFDSVLGFDEVELQIELALDNKRAQDYTKMHLYVLNWLKKAVAWRPQPRMNGRGPQIGSRAPDYTTWLPKKH